MEPLKSIIKRNETLQKLLSEALAIEAEDAKKAGALGFMARAMVQATMPHRKPAESFFERTNGRFTLTMMAPPKVGLPYGTVPRLLMAWLTTEAVRTKTRQLVLGESLSGFMRQLGMVPTGGRWGSITRLRTQSHRLFATSVSCLYNSKGGSGEMGFRVADQHMLWWDPKSPNQQDLFESSVTLSERFFEEIIRSPVPVDMRALRSLSRSPLALDIYTWLTYRLSYLRAPTIVPWPALQAQFGADYKRARDFRAAFAEHLKAVLAVYRGARVEIAGQVGLTLKPSPPHIPKVTSPGF